MSKRAHSLIVAYDIEDDRERRSIDQLLKGWGHRVQKSVYSVKISRYQTHKLQAELSKLEIKTGTILVYRLQANIPVQSFGCPFTDPQEVYAFII